MKTAQRLLFLWGLVLCCTCSGRTVDLSPYSPGATPLSVVSVTPAPGSVDIPVIGKITVTFNKPVSLAMSDLNIIANGGNVSGTITISGNVVVLSPQGNLAEDCDHDIHIGANVKDENGNTLGQEYHSVFRTQKIHSWFTYFGSMFYDTGYDLKQTSDGGYIMVGQSGDVPSVGGKVPIRSHGGGRDFLIVKLNASGGLIWYTFFGAGQSEEARFVTEMPDGGYIIAGESQVSIPSIDGLTPVYPHSGGIDALVVKLSSAGQLMWYSYYGGGNTTYGSGNTTFTPVVFAAAGENIILAVNTINGLTGGASMQPLLPPSSGNTCIIKISKIGQIQWLTYFGGNIMPTSANSTHDFGVILTGDASIPITGLGGKAPLSSHSGGSDTFIARLDTNGTLLWYTFLGSSSMDRSGKIKQTSDGGFILSATAGGNIPSLNGRNPLNPYPSSMCILVAKLSATGLPQWYTFLGGGSGTDDGSVTETAEGGYAVIAQTPMGFTNMAGKPPLTYPTGTGNPFFLTKLTATGEILWYRFFAGVATGYPNLPTGIIATSDGGMAFVGSVTTDLSTQFAKSPIYPYVYPYQAPWDLFIAKLRPDGSL